MKTLLADNITVTRGGRRILSDVSVSLSQGDLLAIVGPNGSGKSTLLRAMGRIWPVSRGSVQLAGSQLERLSRRTVARTVAFVPQEQRIEFAFTVEEVVGMGRYPHRGRFGSESAVDRRAVESALQKCDIVHLRHRTVNTLSGGEHQRVLIARSLAVEPEFILFDEPTANLDVEHTLDILELCRTLAAEGHAVALATHDLNAVARYASKVVLLSEGRVVESGVREQVLTPANIANVFGVEAELLAGRAGQAVFVFHK